jgi:3-oxoacyl-[acyl-carrier protein] reductase
MRYPDLAGKVAIVTGGGRGIGRAICMGLHSNGATVVVVDRNPDTCQSVANAIRDQGGRAVAVPTNVADWPAVKAMVDQAQAQYGTVDLLANNAGILRPTRPLESISEEEWDLVLDVNLKSAFFCTRAVLPLMKTHRRGAIVNTASIAGRSVSNNGGAHYSVSKAGLIGLTRHTARECAGFGIRANAIAPAGVDSEMVPEQLTAEQIKAVNVEARIPAGRLARPEEIANLVVFLFSERSSYITGATIDINGGLLMI